MKITAARFEKGELCLKCDANDAVRFCYGFKEGEYTISPQKKKRSLNANAYAWVLIDKIASALRLSPEEVYRNAVLNTPGVTESAILIRDDAVDDFVRSWTEGHLGRQCRRFPANRKGFSHLIVSYGSSDYDTKQMAAFINILTQDARALNIEVENPARVRSLLDSWEAHHG